MSRHWDRILQSLEQSPLIDCCAICGVSNGKVWASSPTFNLYPLTSLQILELELLKIEEKGNPIIPRKPRWKRRFQHFWNIKGNKRDSRYSKTRLLNFPIEDALCVRKIEKFNRYRNHISTIEFPRITQDWRKIWRRRESFEWTSQVTYKTDCWKVSLQPAQVKNKTFSSKHQVVYDFLDSKQITEKAI